MQKRIARHSGIPDAPGVTVGYKVGDTAPDFTVLLHGSSGDDVWQFIKNKHWNDYPLVFAQDNLDGAKNCLTFRMFGGRDMWPMTVIIDADGKVLYNSTKSFHEYDDLV